MNTNKRTILIIDDSADDLEFYTHLLGKATGIYRYEVLTALDARTGIDLFQNNHVDCTFIDFMMPETDGLAVVDALQALKPQDYIAMVMLTGEPRQKVQAQAARLGALDYVVKGMIKSCDDLEKIIYKTMDWAHALNNGKPDTHA